MNLRPFLALSALTAVLSVSAHAAPRAKPALPACADSFLMVSNPGYIACQGALEGNIASNKVNTATFAGYGTFDLVGISGDTSGAFTADPGKVGSGTLNLGGISNGLFVIGLKGGPTYSLYLFDAALVGPTGVSEIKFDTLGIAKGSNGAGPGLSHAALFMQPVPEPGTWALMAAGLAVVGGLARRRRG
jgi:PEP-CTERM motif